MEKKSGAHSGNQYGDNLAQNRPYVACVASVSARACKESWDENKK